jgi:hypothetical protein
MADIFLSYSRQDRAIADRIELALRERRISVWRDKSRLAPGDPFPKLLGEEISVSKLMLLLWSGNAKNSTFVDLEWGIAIAQKKRILPFCLDGAALPLSLSGFHHVPYQSGEATTAAVAEALGHDAPPPPAALKRTSPLVLGGAILALVTLAALLAAALLPLRKPPPVATPSQMVKLEMNAGAIGAKMQIDEQTKFDPIKYRNLQIPLTLGDHEIIISRDKEPTCKSKVSINPQTTIVPLDCP